MLEHSLCIRSNPGFNQINVNAFALILLFFELLLLYFFLLGSFLETFELRNLLLGKRFDLLHIIFELGHLLFFFFCHCFDLLDIFGSCLLKFKETVLVKFLCFFYFFTNLLLFLNILLKSFDSSFLHGYLLCY